jgi:hypothetical protein
MDALSGLRPHGHLNGAGYSGQVNLTVPIMNSQPLQACSSPTDLPVSPHRGSMTRGPTTAGETAPSLPLAHCLPSRGRTPWNKWVGGAQTSVALTTLEGFSEAHRDKRVRMPANCATASGHRNWQHLGLDCIWKRVSHIPGHFIVGERIRNRLYALIQDRGADAERVYKSIGSEGLGVEDPFVALARESVASELSQILGCPAISTAPVNSSSCTTSIRADLLDAWLCAAGDPAHVFTEWLRSGAPAGISKDLGLCKGLLPESKMEGPATSYENLATDFESFRNYAGVDDSEEAVGILEGYCEKGYFDVHRDLATCTAALEGAPVLSKLACLVKTKVTSSGSERVKRRIILDSKESRVKLATSVPYKCTLPRVFDVVNGALEMMADAVDGEDIELMVADVSDAFWLVPLAPSERRFFCARLRGRLLSFNRIAQGSRTAPLAWSVIASCATRAIQGTFMATGSARVKHSQSVRLNCYVDDPIVIVRGTPSQRKNDLILCLLIWLVLGFPMSFPKAHSGKSLAWIGVQLTIGPGCMSAEITAERLAELLGTTERFLQLNVLPRKEVRSFVGQCQHVANTISVWRPFLADIWAALCAEPSGAPANCLWLRQISTALHWLRAFLRRQKGSVKRVWTLAAYLGSASQVVITADASPFGTGAWLSINGRIVSWFSLPIFKVDAEVLRITESLGSCECQQTVECLALLQALRLWKTSWATVRVQLIVRSDNVTALFMTADLKGRGHGVRTVARELALDLGDGSFAPDLVVHLPGVDNDIADALSRRFQPGKAFNLPAALSGVPEAVVPETSSLWWETFQCAN